jgi:hypothetical protein
MNYNLFLCRHDDALRIGATHSLTEMLTSLLHIRAERGTEAILSRFRAVLW